MPISAKVDINIERYKDAALVPFSLSIVTRMTGNPNFPPPYPSPIPSLNDVSMVITIYQKALVASRGGGTVKTKAKNAAKKDLVALLKPLGRYVDSIANGNKVIILDSGFKVRKPTPKTKRG